MRFPANRVSLEYICTKKKVEQKVTAGEIQQSIDGTVTGETRFKKNLVQFYDIALYFSL